MVERLNTKGINLKTVELRTKDIYPYGVHHEGSNEGTLLEIVCEFFGLPCTIFPNHAELVVLSTVS
jgi:hypothetical protein